MKATLRRSCRVLPHDPPFAILVWQWNVFISMELGNVTCFKWVFRRVFPTHGLTPLQYFNNISGRTLP
jgi:hypothetical protein